MKGCIRVTCYLGYDCIKQVQNNYHAVQYIIDLTFLVSSMLKCNKSFINNILFQLATLARRSYFSSENFIESLRKR